MITRFIFININTLKTHLKGEVVTEVVETCVRVDLSPPDANILLSCGSMTPFDLT